MRAWQCDETRRVPILKAEDVAEPQSAANEILIRVHAAGVTPAELFWYPTTHTQTGENRPNAIPGHEFSGVIAAAGKDVEVEIGQEVFGMNGWFTDGATAQFCCTRSSWVVPKPASLSHQEAAAVPVAGLTASQGLFDRCDLQAGEQVLIHGGSGAVGIFAIQLARWRGARIVTTASARNRELLLQLGADRDIDYHTERFEEILADIDVVFDAVGGATLNRSWQVLRPGGRLVTIARSSETEEDDRTKQAFFIVDPNREQLEKVSGLVGTGELQIVLDAVVPFDLAVAAYANQFSPRRGCGKTIIEVIRK